MYYIAAIAIIAMIAYIIFKMKGNQGNANQVNNNVVGEENESSSDSASINMESVIMQIEDVADIKGVGLFVRGRLRDESLQKDDYVDILNKEGEIIAAQVRVIAIEQERQLVGKMKAEPFFDVALDVDKECLCKGYFLTR